MRQLFIFFDKNYLKKQICAQVEDEVADINYDIERRTCKISGREFKTEAARKTHHKKTYPEYIFNFV